MAGNGDVSFVAYLAKISDLGGLREGLNNTLKKRLRGIWLQVYLLLMGKGHLSYMDDARQDSEFQVLRV